MNKAINYWAVLTVAFVHIPLFGYGQSTSDVFVAGGGQVWALAAQPDGKILLGGYFPFGGRTVYTIARANSDGTLDTDFHPSGGVGVVTALALQVDGKILVGAYVTNTAGQVASMFERLNPDGSQDGLSISGGPGDYVNALAIQPDGKILVGGPFKIFAGQARANLVRINADGTLDTSFNTTMDASPWCIAVQTDGKIVLCGPDFTLVDGQPRKGLARLNADGTLDPGFNPNIIRPMSMALEGDGKILVNATNRLNADGSLDGTFSSPLRVEVNGLAVQTDGKVLATGWDSGLYRLNQDGSVDSTFSSRTNFTGLSLGQDKQGQILVAGSRATLSALTNTEPATESFSYLGTTLTWLRGGSSPEVWWTLFEYSTNGVDWTILGNGSRVAGGWQLSGVVFPPGCSVRASGAVAGGYFNDSCWLAQSYIGAPVLTTQPLSRTNFVGTAAKLSVFAQGSEPLNYQWLRNGLPVPGATGNTLSLPHVQRTDAGAYTVVVTNQFGSSTSSVANMTVLTLPHIVPNDGNFGFTNGQFGFDISGPSGQTVVVEWSGTFGTWLPLQTNVLGGSPVYFSEPRSTKYPRKFYRVRVVPN